MKVFVRNELASGVLPKNDCILSKDTLNQQKSEPATHNEFFKLAQANDAKLEKDVPIKEQQSSNPSIKHDIRSDSKSNQMKNSDIVH